MPRVPRQPCALVRVIGTSLLQKDTFISFIVVKGLYGDKGDSNYHIYPLVELPVSDCFQINMLGYKESDGA